MMNFETFCQSLPTMLDLSCVKANNTFGEIEEMAALAVGLHCAAVFAMPSCTESLCKRMEGTGIPVGGVVGFPSGCETTDTKLFIANQLLQYGCGELDMVINQTALKAKADAIVSDEIEKVAKLCGTVPLKVILEVTNLTDEEICRGSRIAEAAGAAFLKTGTGWQKNPTTLHHVKLIRSALQGKTAIKAAGGITDCAVAYEMYQNGCTRFGVSVASARRLLKNFPETR